MTVDDAHPIVNDRRDRLLLHTGVVLWILAIVAFWPSALSFTDEVGYVGQARLMLDGRLHPRPWEPGVWLPAPHGPSPQYPILLSLLLAPLYALWPRSIFVSGVAAAVGLTYLASRVLRSWGRSPLWALVILAYPTVVTIARTAMGDLLQSAACVATWLVIRRQSRWAMFLAFPCVVALKATGFLLGLALLAGEVVRSWPALRQRDRATIVRLAAAGSALAAAVALTVALNYLVSGRAWFIYDLRFIGKPPFWYEHFPNTASKYAATLLLVPPLLVSGLWPYWRRRELGPLFLICGLIALMSFYFFVDRGRTTVETLIMSPRLILPAVAFLLIGYADNLAALVAWARGGRPALAAPVVALLVAVPLAVALPISVRHRHWQQESAAALAIASRLAAENSDHRLGVDEGTIKAGLLYPGPVTIATLDPAPPPVVACSDTSISYRSPVRRRGCVLPGYHESAAIGAFGVLTRGTSK